MTGENLYGLRKEKLRWIDEFGKKYGQDAIIRLTGKDVTVRDLLDEVGVMPFLAEKRLVVVDGIPKATKEEMQALEGAVHPSTVLLVADSTPDKRLSGVKALIDIATVKTFPITKGKKLLPWIQSEAMSYGMSLAPGVAERLQEELGDDQDAIATELEKLSVAVMGRAVTLEDIERHTIPTDEGVVWTMSDLIAAGNQAGAIRYTRRLLDRGADAYGLWAILLSLVKNLTLVHAALEDHVTDPRAIAERTGIHPFALRSVQSYARRVKRESLKELVAWAAEADVRLKTGGYRATDESPQELHILIDQLLLRFPR